MDTVQDSCTKEGAKRLARMIEAYWRDRGYIVQTSIIHGPHMDEARGAHKAVRSDMDNGFPRTAARKEALAATH